MNETALELNVARMMANDLVERGVDLNEVGKTLAYLQNAQDWGKCLTLMQRLAQTGAVRSKQTRGYYQAIYDICRRHIGKDAKASQAGRILGWAVRLARLPRLEKIERSTQTPSGHKVRPRR